MVRNIKATMKKLGWDITEDSYEGLLSFSKFKDGSWNSLDMYDGGETLVWILNDYEKYLKNKEKEKIRNAKK